MSIFNFKLFTVVRSIFEQPKKEVVSDPMKYLIVGIGNVGAEYNGTRHNVGFEILDFLAEEAGAEWETKTLGDVTTIKHKGRTFTLLKPNTYVNRSGKAVRHWMTKLKVEKSNLLVVVDDLNLPLGKQRLRGKGSDGGHNGLKDINVMAGGNDYARLRIGIGSDFPKGQQADYVLGKWTSEEQKALKAIIAYAAETIKSFGAIGLAHTMSNRNK